MQRTSLTLWIGLLCLGVLPAQDDRDVQDERERANRAAEVMRELVDAPESIPDNLLNQAHAIAVVPHVVKGAFIVGGQYGKGLVSHRDREGNWSPPSYIDLSGASVGFQLGGQTTDYVLVFTNEEGFKPLLKGKVELGGEVSANQKVYGKNVTGTEILLENKVTTNPVVQPFSDALKQLSPPHQHASPHE